MIRSFILLCTIFLSAYADLNVPVVLWSSRNIQDAGSHTSKVSFEQFEHRIVSEYNPENLLLFLQDELSVEDLSSNSKTFENVRNSLKQKHEIYFPAVQNPASLLSDLASHGYNVIKSDSHNVGGLSLKNSEKNLVVVKLPAVTSHDRQSSMEKTAQVMEKILQKTAHLTDFDVILTGVAPNSLIAQALAMHEEHRIRKRNAALKMVKTDCVLMYLNKDLVYVSEGIKHMLPTDKITNTEGICGNSSSTSGLKLSFADIQTLGNLDVQLNFMKKGSRKWYVYSADITEGSKETMTLKAPSSTIHVKMGDSFASASEVVFTSKVGDNGRATHRLRMKGFQAQAFTKGSEKFGRATDNTGFFTIPIWAGIFTGLLFLTILLWGMYMLGDLRTMDRFDNPNDKPLMNPNTAD